MMKKILLYILMFSSCFSCSKLYDIPESSDFTLTYTDTSVKFSDYEFFIIRNTVAVIKDEAYRPDSTELSEISSIIPLVTSELLQRGFRQTDTIANADFSVNIAMLHSPPSNSEKVEAWLTHHNAEEYLEWYSGGSPIWGDFDGFWYPWDYEDVETKPGILLLEVVGAESVRELHKLKSGKPSPGDLRLQFLWQAIISGVLEEGKYNAELGAASIDEAFAQSEYLQNQEPE